MPKVRLFSTPTCPYCQTLKGFLEDNNVEFEEVDVAADANAKIREEMVKKSGQMGVPVVEIDGQMIVGFDRKKIVKLLNIKD